MKETATKIKNIKSNYTVICGNIGYVELGTESYCQAFNCFETYVEQSNTDYGRAAGENVAMFRDGDLIKEYVGTLETEYVGSNDYLA